MINRLLYSRGSKTNRSSGPADVRTHPCGLPQTSAPIHADVCTNPCGRPHQSMRTSVPIHADVRIDVHKDVRIDVHRLPRTSLRTTADLHMEILRTSAQKKFPACVDVRTKHPNTPQTSAGKCPQFSMRNITFFADISGMGLMLPTKFPDNWPFSSGREVNKRPMETKQNGH